MTDRIKCRLYLPQGNQFAVSPELAAEIGLNESIILMRVERLSITGGTVKDGHRWALMDAKDLKTEFPWLGATSVGKTIDKMVENKLLLSARYHVKRRDTTRWLTPHYSELNRLSSVKVWDDEGVEPAQPALLSVPSSLSSSAKEDFEKQASKSLARAILYACRYNPKMMTDKDWGQIRWAMTKLRARHPDRPIPELGLMIEGFGIWWLTKTDKQTGDPFLSPKPDTMVRRWEDYLHYCEKVLSGHIPVRKDVTPA